MNYALLLLAGNSKRFNHKTPKQFFIVKNKPIYYYSLKALQDSPLIDEIIVLTLDDKIMEVFNFVKKEGLYKAKTVIAGGMTRSETVKFGLKKLESIAHDDDLVLIHDAARPLLDNYIIETAIKETKVKSATTFALHSYDTLVKAKNYIITSYLDRNEVFRLQTPQTFTFKLINQAYQNFKNSNDDTELVYLLNKQVHLLKGNERLFKVTNFDDVKKLENYLNELSS